MFVDRTARLARHWSNRHLRLIAPLFTGRVVNVSAWDDRDKQGGTYRDYFANAASYEYTNYSGDRGVQNMPGEHFLDLTAPLPEAMKARFDVVFNHTTLEHVFDVRTAFANLCGMTTDVVITVVPFAQLQHEATTWKDYWRFTPTCMRALFAAHGLEVVYESCNEDRNAATYLVHAATRRPDHWRARMPAYEPIAVAGAWIGRSWLRDAAARLLGRHRPVPGRMDG
jgi:hypothetical protein